ncbi:MAG: A24 family peptidase [Bythopirellula sp.]|nr:A24 family peptidase [Bythopirellula sp.]
MILAALQPSLVLVGVFLLGTALGSLANWAIYRLAWNPREISPWGPRPENAKPRAALDRVPVIGWLGLARESEIHGQWFWVRPMLLELAMGAGLAALCWWEVFERGLIVPQLVEQLQIGLGQLITVDPYAVPFAAVWPTFLSHVLLITLMAAASFIDIDEKIIPDEITVPGTILGLVVAACLPLSLLPLASFPDKAPALATAIDLSQIAPGLTAYVEPTTLSAPNPWPTNLEGAPNLRSLALGLGCWWLWCFALAPRIWRGRRSALSKLKAITRRVIRELTRPPLGVIAGLGTLAIAGVWYWGDAAWVGLLTALVGLAASGALVWIVRLVGTAALGREAMGFGDVTLMMMIGTFLGWQACVVVFFVAPFAGLVVGIAQAITKRDDVIPYGPFLCLGALFVIVFWASVWNRVEFAFQLGWLMPAVLAICFVLLGVMLFIWQQIKLRLFAAGVEE